jgi:hypothetical protein
MESAGNHQMDDEPHIALKTDGDALGDVPDLKDFFPFRGCDRRIRGAQQKGVGDPHMLQRLSEDAASERFSVEDDIGQFGHDIVTKAGEDLTARAQSTRRKSLVPVLT